MGTRTIVIVLDGRRVALTNRLVGNDGYAAARAWLGQR
jgi:hypothetical protein